MEGNNEEDNEEEEIGLRENVPGQDQGWVAMGYDPEEEDGNDEREGYSGRKSVDPLVVRWDIRAWTIRVSNECRYILLLGLVAIARIVRDRHDVQF